MMSASSSLGGLPAGTLTSISLLIMGRCGNVKKRMRESAYQHGTRDNFFHLEPPLVDAHMDVHKY